MKISNLKRTLFSIFTIASVAFLLTSCEQESIEIPNELALNSKAEMAKYLAIIENPSLVILDETNSNNEVSSKTDGCANWQGGESCAEGYVQLAFERFDCYQNCFEENPNEVNRINRDTAFCDFLLAFNFCNGANFACP